MQLFFCYVFELLSSRSPLSAFCETEAIVTTNSIGCITVPSFYYFIILLFWLMKSFFFKEGSWSTERFEEKKMVESFEPRESQGKAPRSRRLDYYQLVEMNIETIQHFFI